MVLLRRFIIPVGFITSAFKPLDKSQYYDESLWADLIISQRSISYLPPHITDIPAKNAAMAIDAAL